MYQIYIGLQVLVWAHMVDFMMIDIFFEKEIDKSLLQNFDQSLSKSFTESLL